MINWKNLFVCILSLAIITGCQQVNKIEALLNQNNTKIGSITGVALIPTTDKTWAPAVSANVKVVNEKGEEIASGKTNEKGQFLVSNIPFGKVKINVSTTQSSTEMSEDIDSAIFPLGTVKLDNAFIGGGPSTITGKVIDQNNQPVAGAKITDITGGTASSITDSKEDGKFSLIVPQLDKPRTLEISAGTLVTSTTVNPEKTSDLSIVLIANSRTLTGIVNDGVNKSLPVKGATVTISGSAVSTITNDKGEFSLRGVTLNQLTVEAGGLDGYMKGNTIVNAANSGESTNAITVYMTPIGSLRINLARADSFQLLCFDEDCSPTGLNIGVCTQPKEAPENDNVYYHTNSLEGSIMIEGTTIKQTFEYPPTPTQDIMATCGSEPKRIGTIHVRNVVKSIQIDNIPGGVKHVTVSMTGMETQKGVEIVIPSSDVISTELILLHDVQPAVVHGDISGKITGVDAADIDNIRVGSLAVSEPFDMTGLLAKLNYFGATSTFKAATIEDVLNRGVKTVGGNYLLTNVPTGTRIVIAGVVNSDGNYDTTYITKATVLTNVVGGKVNRATDINLEKHAY